MSKAHCDHRVVQRGPNDNIINDYPFENFACALPEYERLSSILPDGHKITLQHGARVIFETPGNSADN